MTTYTKTEARIIKHYLRERFGQAMGGWLVRNEEGHIDAFTLIDPIPVEPDIRMRIWIPYSLKFGLGETILHQNPKEYDCVIALPETFEWVEFVAVNDPLVNKAVEAQVRIRVEQPKKTLIFKTLDDLCERMSKGYVVKALLKWIIKQE